MVLNFEIKYLNNLKFLGVVSTEYSANLILFFSNLLNIVSIKIFKLRMRIETRSCTAKFPSDPSLSY